MSFTPEKIRQIKQASVEIGYEQAAAHNGNGHKAGVLPPAVPAYRTVHLTKASSITVRPVHWLWHERIALGAVTLIGGREGIGKSIVGYTVAADITRGKLPGVYAGQSRAVAVAATEDSWSHTVVPRLMAAGADLDLVYRVDVVTSDAIDAGLSLPRDLPSLEDGIRETGAALVLLDPLLSRLDAALDSHKDQQVRLALEPLVALAERTRTTIAGLIHVNKSTSDDPLTTLMASRAFAAVARSVLFVMTDPNHEGSRLLGMAKNNLGRLDLPTLSFTIAGEKVAETAEGDVWTGKLLWTGESDQTIREAMQAAVEVAGINRTVVAEAADWLSDYLESTGGSADSADVKREGGKAGHSQDALKRARHKIRATSAGVGFPRRTFWALQSEQPVGASSGESALTALTAPTAPTGPQSVQSVQSVQSGERQATRAPTGPLTADGKPFVFDGRPV